jgi:hypothetical protein
MLQSVYIEFFPSNCIKYPYWCFKLYKVCTFWSIGTRNSKTQSKCINKALPIIVPSFWCRFSLKITSSYAHRFKFQASTKFPYNLLLMNLLYIFLQNSISHSKTTDTLKFFVSVFTNFWHYVSLQNMKYLTAVHHQRMFLGIWYLRYYFSQWVLLQSNENIELLNWLYIKLTVFYVTEYL